MVRNLIVISRQNSAVIDEKTLPVDTLQMLAPFKQLQDLVCKEYSVNEDEMKMYWRWAPGEYMEINSYISYAAAYVMSAEQIIYAIIFDQPPHWRDNGKYLKALDLVEERKEERKARSVYDIKIRQPGEVESEDEDDIIIKRAENSEEEFRSDAEVIDFAIRKRKNLGFYTADMAQYRKLVEFAKLAFALVLPIETLPGWDNHAEKGQAERRLGYFRSKIKKIFGYFKGSKETAETASLLCFANILGMKGEIISCPHKDIYFLETNAKSETTDLANLFASPAGREMVKYKPRTKLKNKLNPALEFFVQNKTAKTTQGNDAKAAEEGKCGTSGGQASERTSRRNSLDLYEEAATILGLTCSQTDDCKCIECQCHYFDFDDDIDFQNGDCMVEHPSSCSIQ